MLAEVLADPERLEVVDCRDALGEAAAILEDAASNAVGVGGWTADDPLRLSKGPIGWLLRCPRRAVSADDGLGRNLSDELAIGLLVDAGAKLATLGPTDPVTIERALEYLVASGDTTLVDPAELVDLPDGDGGPQSDLASQVDPALLAEAGVRLAQLVDGWPDLGPSWWPRVEEPVRVRLADGRVTLSGRLDVLLGGPPTERPGLVVEIKSGRWHDGVRSDAHLYGLLVGLRNGCAPAAVLSIAAADGATQLEPIRPAVLVHTAERVAVAMDVAARLVAGEPPATCPGRYCAHCPVLDGCDDGRAAVTAVDAVAAAGAVVA